MNIRRLALALVVLLCLSCLALAEEEPATVTLDDVYNFVRDEGYEIFYADNQTEFNECILTESHDSMDIQTIQWSDGEKIYSIANLPLMGGEKEFRSLYVDIAGMYDWEMAYYMREEMANTEYRAFAYNTIAIDGGAVPPEKFETLEAYVEAVGAFIEELNG